MKIRCFPHCCAPIWDSSQWHVQSLTASYISTLQIHQIRTWARRRGLQEGEEGGRYEEMHMRPPTYKEAMWAAQLFLPLAAKLVRWRFGGFGGVWENWGHICSSVGDAQRQTQQFEHWNYFWAAQLEGFHSTLLLILAAAAVSVHLSLNWKMFRHHFEACSNTECFLGMTVNAQLFLELSVLTLHIQVWVQAHSPSIDSLCAAVQTLADLDVTVGPDDAIEKQFPQGHRTKHTERTCFVLHVSWHVYSLLIHKRNG